MGGFIGVENGRASFDVPHGFFVVVFHVVYEDFGDEWEDVFFEDLGGVVEASGEADHLLDAFLVGLLEEAVADELYQPTLYPLLNGSVSRIFVTLGILDHVVAYLLA